MRTTIQRLSPIALAALLALYATYPAEAQTSPAVNPDDVASVRGNFSALATWLQAHAVTPSQQVNAKNLGTQIAGLTDDQWALVTNAVTTASDVSTFTTVVTTLMKDSTSAPKGTTMASGAPITTTLTDPPYDICNPATGSPYFGSPIPSNTQGVFDISVTIDTLKAVADDLNFTVCQTTFVVAGEGTNIAGCIATLLLTEVIDGLQISKDGLTFCDSNASQAEVTAAWRNTIDIDQNLTKLSDNTQTLSAALTNQLNVVEADLSSHATAIGQDLALQIASANVDIDNRISNSEADLINKSTAVDTDIKDRLNLLEGDLLTRDTQIDSEISTFQALTVRTQIEQSLAAGQIVGLFELPQANGGYLETVRAIVNDTISKLLAAGQAVNGATKWLGLGDTALSGKQYKAAYANYVTAYGAAVK